MVYSQDGLRGDADHPSGTEGRPEHTEWTVAQEQDRVFFFFFFFWDFQISLG